MKISLKTLACLFTGMALILTACIGTHNWGNPSQAAAIIKLKRAGGTPISDFAFGNNYFNWVDWGKNGMVALLGTEAPVKDLRLNVVVGDNNQNDANFPQLFDKAQMDRYIEYCRAVGAEPIMIVPVYGNNVDGGPTSAEGAADIVTYINGTMKYGVQYWTIGMEVDIYDQFFKNKPYPVKNVDEYAAIFKSYAQAMIKANAEADSGVELKFVAPELGWRYFPGNDWLSPMLDKCKEYIDVASIHNYGFAAKYLTIQGALTDVDNFRKVIKDVKALVAKHGRRGMPLAVTEANICYDWDPKSYTAAERMVGPGSFYAAIWDADRMGVALEENLWTMAFWDLAETVQMANDTVFGFILTDPSKNPPAYKLTPEYYTQWMVNTNFSGDTIIPSGVPKQMSVYACYDVKKAATVLLVVNKAEADMVLTFAIDDLKLRTIIFAPLSINIVTIPDDKTADYHMIEYNKKMADIDLPPQTVK